MGPWPQAGVSLLAVPATRLFFGLPWCLPALAETETETETEAETETETETEAETETVGRPRCIFAYLKRPARHRTPHTAKSTHRVPPRIELL